MNASNLFYSISFAAGLLSAAIPSAATAGDVDPVLMVIANQDFYHQEYSEVRSSLEAQGLEVIVSAATTDTAIPHRSRSMQDVSPDIALTDVNADDYSTIVFVGGYGAASYQYANETTYDNPAYNLDPRISEQVNYLIGNFIHQRKYVTAVCYGVTVLAYARVDGVSPIEGRNVVAWAGGGPGFTLNDKHYADNTVPTRRHIEDNGGVMPLSAAVGDPLTSEDDVIVDGQIITAENYDSAYNFGQVLAKSLIRNAVKR